MSLVPDSPDATSLGGATGSLPESGESIQLKQQKSESESESESDFYYESPSDSDSESVTPPWKLKPIKDLKESDFSVYDNDPKPYFYINNNFTYKNQAMIDKEKALAEFMKNRVIRSSWDAEAVPISFGLCGGIRPYTITEDRRPRLIHYSNLSLNKYNAENQGANFVFDDLVKATCGASGYTYYITFKATDASNNSSLTQTFQAQVTDRTIDKDAKPIVHLIRLKPIEEEPIAQ